MDGNEKDERRIAKYLALYKDYEEYLDRYTMRVVKEDFVYPQDLPSLVFSLDDLGLDDNNVHDKQVLAKLLETGVTFKNESSKKESDEIKLASRPEEGILIHDSTGVACRNTSITKTQEGEERRSPLFLQFLEKKRGHDKETRQAIVDAQCGICLTNVQEGDEIVWSRLECRHIFHRKCMLPRLAREEKQCPICRNWFATGATASSCSVQRYRFDPPGVFISVSSTAGSIKNSFSASLDPMRASIKRKDYVLVRGEGFFFYPLGKWVTVRCNSNGYSFAYACVAPPGCTYEEKIWLQYKE